MTEIIGFVCAIFIGIILGLIGGGGSILTIPVLVYILGVETILATSYSLFITGTTALFGAIKNIKNGTVNLRVGLIFAFPSLISIYLTRRFIITSLPEKINITERLIFYKEELIMLFFAIIMLFSAFYMLKKRKERNRNKEIKYLYITLEGLIVGVISGLIGVGGGFLIIPALVFAGGLSMKIAVGTSLIIITLKSFIGIIGDLYTPIKINYLFLLKFSFFSVVGMSLGLYISKFMSEEKLKKIFGFFVLFISVFIFIKELY